jgi:hypothetical protein
MGNEKRATKRELTTEEASAIAGLSRNQITNLLRRGKLEGRNFGQRYWIVYADSLEKYLATPRRTGPKGPRKKPTPGKISILKAPANKAEEQQNEKHAQ